MRESVTRLLDQFDARSIRERLLIGLTVFAVTWAVWIGSIGGLVLDDRAEIVTHIDRLARDLQLQSDERLRLQQADNAPVRQVLKRQQTRLQALILTQQEELDDLLARFIAPAEVPMLLEDVLHDYTGLKLIRLSSKPAEALLLKVQPQMSGAIDPASITIYRHPVQLEFEGGYLDVVAYLAALESGKWRFAWRKFEYAVSSYPTAQVLIELETLSREREWLGV